MAMETADSPPPYGEPVWTTQNHDIGGNPVAGYSGAPPPPYTPQPSVQPQQLPGGGKPCSRPYAPPPMPGYYAPLPTGAPPPYEAVAIDMRSAPQNDQLMYSPPLQPQPISMQQKELAALVAVKSQGSRKRFATCCKVMLSMLGHLGFFACLGFMIFHLYHLQSGYNLVLVFGLGAGFLVFAYLLIQCEAYCSDTRRYVSNVLEEGNLRQFVNGLRSTRPQIYWYIECYHYETRTRDVEEQDADGNRQTRSETYQQRVATHSEKKEYQFSQWRDVSPPTPELPSGTVSRIAMYKTFTFANERAMLDYKTQKDNFYLRNVGRDRHVAFNETLSIDGFKERVTAYADEKSRKYCVTHAWYWITSALLCTWPYRCWFRRTTTKTNYCLIKEFGE